MPVVTAALATGVATPPGRRGSAGSRVALGVVPGILIAALAAWLAWHFALGQGLQRLHDGARQRLEVEATRLDGQLRQDYPVADIRFPVPRLLSLISHDMTLEPGDVILCGTSVGVGSMKNGQTVEVEIEGIGSLRNRFETPQG